MKSYLILAIFFLLASCQKRRCYFGEENYLQGKWKWEETSGGIAGIVTTPASTGDEIYLELLNDGTYIFSKNKIVAQQGTYSAGAQFCYHTNTTKPCITLDNTQVLTIEMNDAHNLYLAEEYADGLNYKYSK